MSSLLQGDEKKCYVCGKTTGLHKHEVFYGTSNRAKSIRYGCQVWLCGHHHNMSNDGIHFDKALDLKVKKLTQEAFEQKYSHEFFMQVFKKNYL